MSNIKKTLEIADVAVQLGKKGAKKYLITLAIGVSLAFLPFLLMTWFGVETDSRWLILAGSLWRVVIGLGVGIIFALIAIPILYILRGTEGIEAYFRGILGAVLVALCTSLIVMVTPLKANPENIPVFVLCLIILGIILTVNFNIRIIGGITGIIFVITLLSFYFPGAPSEIKNTIGSAKEKRPAAVAAPRPAIRQHHQPPAPKKKNNYPTGNYKLAVMVIGSEDDSNQLSQLLNDSNISTTNSLRQYIPSQALNRIMGGDGKAVLDLHLQGYAEKIIVGKKKIERMRLRPGMVVVIRFDFWIISTGDGSTKHVKVEKEITINDSRDEKIAAQMVTEAALTAMKNSLS